MPDDYEVIGETPSQTRPRPRVENVTPADVPTRGAPTGESNYEVIGETPSQSQSAQPDQPGVTADVKAAGEALYKRGMEIFAEKDKTIDYSKGAKYSTQMLVQRADNPNEIALQLEKIYGPKNYGQDSKGGWWVKEDGKQVSVFREGIKGSLEKFGTGLAAQAPITAGAGVGAVAGGMVGGAMFPAGGEIPGAMIGAATAKGLTELTKWYEGVFSKTPSQTASHMLNEGTIAGLFQGAPTALKGTYDNLIKKGLRWWWDVSKETAAQAQHLRAGGAVPPIRSYAPGATAMEFERAVRNNLAGGNPKEVPNIMYMDRRLREVFAADGMQPQELGEFMASVYNNAARTSTTIAGESLVAKAQTVNRDTLNAYESIRSNVEQVLRADEQTLRNMAQAPTSLSPEIAANIVQRRRDFGRLMGGMYEQIDNMNGDRMVVPIQGIHDAARDLVDVMPPGSVPPVIARWADPAILQQQAQGVPRIRFQEAHALRTMLREMGDITDIRAAGMRPRNAREMANAVDEAMDMAMGSAGQQQAAALRRADELYRQGIRQFDDATIKKLAKVDKSGLPPDPGTVVDYFMHEDNPALAAHIVNHPSVTPQMRQQIVQADLGNMLQRASVRGKDGQLKLDGRFFMDDLDKRHRLLSVTYPPNLLNHLRTLARDVAAFDGQIDVTKVQNPSALIAELQHAVATRRAAEEFAKVNGFQALLDGTPQQIDAAVGRFTTPGDEAATEQAVRALGIDSPQWESVRRYAQHKLFADAVESVPVIGKAPVGVPPGKRLSAEKITSRLSSYTSRQQELLFPHGLKDDILFIAKEINFLFPHGRGDIYGEFSAGSVKAHLPWSGNAIRRAIKMHVTGEFADSKFLLNFLTKEIKRNPYRGRRVLGLIVQTMMSRAASRGRGGAPTLPGVSPSRKNQEQVPAGAGIYGDTE